MHQAEREALGVEQKATEGGAEELTGAAKLAYLQNKARALSSEAKDTGIDTLVTVDAQLEQTRRDNKKLLQINVNPTSLSLSLCVCVCACVCVCVCPGPATPVPSYPLPLGQF